MNAANLRIAKNTVYMYIRLFTVMVIGLYTSRLVLEILGVSDYGLFSVVGGVLAMFTFISTSLASATSRFLNVEMGKPDGDVNRIFNINLLLHAVLSCIILLLAETVGLWYVCNQLNVADGKLDDAIFVYQVSILTACMGIINTPFQSLFIAHERFRFLAVLDIINAFIRLGCILLLSLYHGDNTLRIYSFIFALTTVNTFAVYHYAAKHNWPHTVSHRFVRGWHRYKEVLNFNNWNLLATLSFMARSSGSALIINSFFGTAVNGALTISNSVQSYVSDFSSKFDGASAPQIVQSYAAGDKPRYTYLANKIGRINILIFELICFPILMEPAYILHIWLGQVPEGAVAFTCLNLILGGVAATSGGMLNIITASGQIKWFKIEISIFFLSCLPIGYALFSVGYPPHTLLVLFLIADILQRIVQLTMVHYILEFDAWQYVKEAYTRPAIILGLMGIAFYAHHQTQLSTLLPQTVWIMGTFLMSAFLIYIIGLTHEERNIIRHKLHIRGNQ